MRKTKMGKSLLTIILTLVMIFETLLPSFMIFAAENGYKGGAGIKVSDLDTSTKYSLSLGDNASTEYAGRIWTDKSVFTGDASFETFGGGTSVIKLNEGGNLGEDFLIAYSALATSESVSGQTQAPVDVVLVIDISGSMSNSDSNMDNDKSRIYNTVKAANDAIDKLMALNPYTRVAVVAFSSNAQVLLPLDRYTKDTEIERVWVSTGNYPWQGYYEETEVEMPYFSVSPESASRNNATLTTQAINSKNQTVSKTTSVSGGTNTQVGIYEGMQILAEEDEKTVNIDGKMVQRVPSVIILSDGASTYSSSSSSWWAPADNYNDGPGNGAYAGNGMKAIMTASYMKDAIDRNYGVTGTAYSTTVYTVGMGITGLSTDERNLAYMTLNPGRYWNDNTVTNDKKTAIKGYWSDYTKNNNTASVSISVGRNDNYSMTHPTTGFDVNPQNGYNYVDGYYDADNASAVTDVFSQIVTNISISAPQIPTEMKGTNPITDGYITYTDPIGEYMEVKDIKAIIYAGETFTAKSSSVSGNVTTYIFGGSVHSPVYGDQEIRNIVITVEETNGKQTLVVKIPASVIPLRVNEVVLNADGSVKQHTNNGAFPARVIYSVGLQSEIVKESNDGVAYIDKSKLSADYIAENTNADGSINFYSNIYKGDKTVNGSTAGNAIVEFEPSHDNKFYYIIEDIPIYKDSAFTQKVKASEGINDNTVYYLKDIYYHGTSVEVTPIERTGIQLKRTDIKTGDDGNLYRKAGSHHLNRILKFEGTKVNNATGTAEDFYAPTFEFAAGSEDDYEGKFVVYQGNNGRLTMVAGGNLEIRKTVTAAQGLNAPDKTFEFTLDLDGDEVNNGEYDYAITDAQGKTVSTGTVSKNNTKVYLKDGQIATVFGLPPSTTYRVVETAASGFTAESDGATGTILANTTSVATFTNTYNVSPVVFPANGGIKGQKQLEGRAWSNNDKFTFFISPYNNAPLPEGYDADKGIVVTAPDAVGGDTATFNFGTITFTAPGVYLYTVFEKEPENDEYLPGISYSRALFRVVANVVDNGDGTLKIQSSDIQKLYNDDATQLFTYGSNNEIVMNNGQEAQDAIKFVNTYSPKSVVRVPVALKDYTDNSGMNPLASGMFEFKLEAVGYIVGNNGLVTDVSKVPMPEGSVNGVSTTTNEGHNVTFPSVEFTHNNIPEGAKSITFRYKMSEVIPANKVNGMTYDNRSYTIDVVVSIDASSDTLNVSAIYPNDERIITFKNEYTQKPVSADIKGNKTLFGRDMKNGETFEFAITGANAATNNAVRLGNVVIPADTAFVKDGKDGKAVDFAFSGIQFKKAGTYYFNVTETMGNAPAVEYDSNTVSVTVVIDDADKDGNLEVTSVTYSNGKAFAEFTNTYTTEFEGTPVSLSGEKNLTGKTLLDGEFYFNVAEYYNDTFVKEGLVTHTKDTEPDANGVYTGSIVFLDNLTYDKAGKYVYVITEQIPESKVGGTDYDESKFRYTVTVEDVDKVGKLTVTSKSLQKLNGNVWENANSVVFNNEYTPEPATAVLPLIKKVVAGERTKALEADEFKFEISKISAVPTDGMILPANTVVGNKANGDVVFGAITFTKAGTYTVSVKEIIPEDAQKIAGITYSTQEIIATYSVVDNRNGVLTATLTEYDGGSTIINNYTAEPEEIEISIKKNFTGRNNDEWLATDKFDFEVVVLDPATLTSIENGEIEFPTDGDSHIVTKTISADTPNKTISGKIKINRPGTFKFIVREITGSISGVHYDSQPREITIIATDNSQTAQLETTVKVNGQQTDNLTLTFNNVYDTTSTELSGHDNLTIKKNFTGREGNRWLDTDKFVFTLEAVEDTLTAVANGDVVMPMDCTLTVSNANKAHPHFGNIVFNKVGQYKFKVSEVKGNIEGVEYDESDKFIAVSVVDNDQGALVVKVLSESDVLEFNNSYSADDVVVSGATYLEITKSLVGREWFADDKFEFVIKALNDAAADAIDANDIVMPAMNTIEIKPQSAGNHGNIKGHFGDIVFKKAGDYSFVITEKSGNIDNIDYDAHSYHVHISVTDNNQGKLVASVTYHSSDIFVNTYTPDEVTAQIKGEKELSGNRPLATGDFEFNIIALTAGAPMPHHSTVKNSGNSVDFGTVSFSKAGTYVYQIGEIKGNIPGVTYDTAKVTATVTVTYDGATGKLSSSVSYVKGNGSAQNTFVFENSYKAAASEPVSLTAKKKVTATEGNSFILKGSEFKFAIEGIEGAPMPDNTVVQNDANGNVDFGTVKFTEKGTYKYTVREVQESLAGFTYDSEVYTITVTVTDDIANAKLLTSVEITDSDNNDAEIVFDNKYNPKETSALIFGKKELDSEHKQIEADEFEFVIEAETQNAPMPDETTVKNTATGTFQFGTITYTKVGTYKYNITEKDSGKLGYTYDDATYNVTVTVTDEGKGELKAVVSGVGTVNDPTVKFVNKYEPKAVDLTLGADGEFIKNLDGRDLRDKEFEFAVLDGSDEKATAKNDQKGKFEFTLNFTKADTYNYTVVEKNNSVAGVKYDETVYDVEIVVIDNDGKLEVKSVVYTLEDNEVDEIVFNNTYKAEKTNVVITALKTLKGRNLNDGEFKFVIKDKDGKVVATAVNAKDGKIDFGKIIFDETGVYEYTVSEEKGTLENVTYDVTEYTISIEVKDDGNGELKAEKPVIKKSGSDAVVTEITFENTYSAPQKPVVPSIPKTGDTSNISLWLALFFVNSCIFGTIIYRKKRVK